MASNLLPPAVDASLFRRFGFGQREDPPFRCVHHAFEYHVRSDASAIAAEHLGKAITYGELDRRANTLAHRLRAVGVQPGARVCLLVQRSIPMVVGIMAILKAGGSYVPLDGGIVTDSTLAFVLKNANCTLVLTLTDYVHRVADFPHVNLDEEMKSGDGDYSKPEDLSNPDDSCYIIYTSGGCFILLRVTAVNESSSFRHNRYSEGCRSYASQCN